MEVLVNPASGLLKWEPAYRQMMRHLKMLADARNTADSPRAGLEVRFHETQSRNHAGGDGFHNDICTALLRSVPDIMQNVILFRLPMGTGNDNADAPTVEEAFAILGSAANTRQDALIETTTARGEVHYGFNLASQKLGYCDFRS